MQHNAVAGNRFAINVDFEIGFTDDAVSIYRLGPDRWNLAQHTLDLYACLFYGLQIGAFDLQAHGRTHARL